VHLKDCWVVVKGEGKLMEGCIWLEFETSVTEVREGIIR
jgi:hypothetical protein